MIPDDIIGPDQRAIIVAGWGHHGALWRQFKDHRRFRIITPNGSSIGFRADIIVFYGVDPWDPYGSGNSGDAERMERIINESLITRFAPEAWYNGAPMVFL